MHAMEREKRPLSPLLQLASDRDGMREFYNYLCFKGLKNLLLAHGYSLLVIRLIFHFSLSPKNSLVQSYENSISDP